MAEHDVDVQGITLHCQTWGEQTQGRQAVLLVHGLTSSSQAWAMLGPALAQRGFFVVAPDLRGRGLSGKPDHGYGIPFDVGDLLALCDAFHLSTVHAVGHSLGAQTALYMSAIYAERIDRLVLVDAGGEFPADARQLIAASLARLDTVYPSHAEYLATMQRLPIHPWDHFWEQYYRYDALVHEDGTVTSRVPRWAIDEQLRGLETLRLDALPEMARSRALIVRATVGMLGPDQGFMLPAAGAGQVTAAMAESRL